MILRFRVSYNIVEEEDLVDDGVVIYAAAVAVGGRAIAQSPPLHTPEGVAVPADAADAACDALCLSLLVAASGSVLLVHRRFWSLWNRDRAATSAGPSSRGLRYCIEE